MIPHLWGGYAYRGAESVTLDSEQVHKDARPVRRQLLHEDRCLGAL